MIIEGDVLDVLPTLDAESVHCVVTSPPYWGLRDYGTASWVGGDEDHEHVGVTARTSPAGTAKQASNAGAVRHDQQIGLEPTPDAYIERMVAVFREVRRVLRKDGTVWLNIGDSYAASAGAHTGRNDTDRATPGGRGGSFRGGERTTLSTRAGVKPKDLVGIPWMLAFALRADGWWLRGDIVWAKPNPMPESVTDRPTRSHEFVFLLTKSARYYFDADAVREPAIHAFEVIRDGARNYTDVGDSVNDRRTRPRTIEVGAGRNIRDVWTIATEPFAEAHFATFPKALVEPCMKAGTSEAGCCATCAAPWRREVERVSAGRSYAVEKSAAKRGAGLATAFSGYDDGSSAPEFRTLGWSPTCGHAIQTVPCTVLDPFAGSGTTGVVAAKYGRDFVGVELNPEYAEMARRRIANWRREYATTPAPKVLGGQLDLIGGNG